MRPGTVLRAAIGGVAATALIATAAAFALAAPATALAPADAAGALSRVFTHHPAKVTTPDIKFSVSYADAASQFRGRYQLRLDESHEVLQPGG